MRWIHLTLACALLACSVSAQDQQDQKDAVPQSSTSVLVNGQPIKGKVLEIEGKHFVAVEDLAQSLRGTISYIDGQVALTLSQPPPTLAQLPVSQSVAKPAQPPPSPSSAKATQPPSAPPPVLVPVTAAQPATAQSSADAAQLPASQVPVAAVHVAEPGNVKGTLTYFFSFHDGNKPDAGSKVWLVRDRVEIPADQNFVGSSTALGTSANPDQYPAIRFAVADESGNFEMRDIPPGQYTLILQSAHTKGTLKDKRNFFGRGNRLNPRDSVGRVESVHTLIKAGETADASKDFGPNIE